MGLELSWMVCILALSEGCQTKADSSANLRGEIVPSASAAVSSGAVLAAPKAELGNVRRNVSIGGVTVSGGNVSNAARVVAGLRTGLRDCYSRDAAESIGSIRFTISVGASGAVTNAIAQTSGGLSAAVVDCSLTRVRAARFAAPDGGQATVTVPTTFVVQSTADGYERVQ